METNNCAIDFITQTITITKKFARAARQYGSYECDTLLRITRELPNFRIQLKYRCSNPCRPYQPTYREMERVIAQLDDERVTNEFEMMRAYRKYHVVLRWFKSKFPNLESTLNPMDAEAA